MICCRHMFDAHPCCWVLLLLKVVGLLGYRLGFLWACIIALSIVCFLLATLSLVFVFVFVFVGCQGGARATGCVSCDLLWLSEVR